MEFWQSIAVTETDQLIELAKFAEELGFAGVTLADHLVKPRDISSSYPYSPDGSPFWQADEPAETYEVTAVHGPYESR